MSLDSYLKALEEQRKHENGYNDLETHSSNNRTSAKNQKVSQTKTIQYSSVPRNLFKSKTVAYLLWLFGCFGCFGLHRFYLNKWGTGLLWFITGGLCGLGAFVDLFTLGGKVELYNTRIETQQIRRDIDYRVNNNYNTITTPAYTEYTQRNSKEPIVTYVQRKPSSQKSVILILSILAILFIAVLKNPTETQAKAEINTLIKEKVNENIRKELSEGDKTELNKLGAGLAMMFTPAMIDHCVLNKISNYIFFSTFETSYTYDGEYGAIASGIIIFGKVIPLKSNYM
ncbi:MAG: TM2 domain-containing protein [Muribaculaceae bacterium]|nr:TM2 domain-containing protein [Muribaculaceae bacterium]